MSDTKLFSDECIEQLKQDMHKFIDEVQKALKPLIDAFREAAKAFTRWLFSLRLLGLGLPARLAEWTAWKLPWRWMPVKWIYGWTNAP